MKTPSGLSSRADAGGDPREIGNVAHHVRRKNRVGAAMFGDDVVGELAVEERADRVDAAAARHFGDVDRRLDAQMTDAALVEMPQHDAVVAAQLDDERVARGP